MKSQDIQNAEWVKEYIKEGDLAYNAMNYQQAIICYTSAIELDPKNKVAYFKRAMSFFWSHNFSLARKDRYILINLD
ncbi:MULTISPECIES: tetratricopeptide repeat protein [Legionella]|uniref:Uncharacterized protein n=1 Tax=Legionella septentrionalis TaxID=2498109 RepID=A0A3S0X5X0_9GAMM|nr:MULTISPECIES: hypothetical protein [Legionella]MCP0913042.1 hypothetical protein [Legionella sp. 27cVA30]RUQ91497.1 hypothetical protein EKM59_00075 [Legionella septentrionalis]RUQ98499.1 hypothetical protein ELY11_05605 [Legionella septentrionalis]RUR10883.1 hypothetical protein ELY14_03505 [Legionella septentrionalis]RUR14583.1 hypothetical protein ELY10_08155 [Legionella septentrionalis]